MKIVSYALTDFISTIFGRIQWNEIYDMICVSRHTPLSVRDASVFNFYKLFLYQWQKYTKHYPVDLL